jgi:uncharacterized protein (TIGR03437 family)
VDKARSREESACDTRGHVSGYPQHVSEVISLMGVRSSASLLPGPVSPGEIISIFGSGIGPTTGVGVKLNASGFIENLEPGREIFLTAVPVALIFVRADQINAVVPYEAAGRTTTRLQVEYLGTTSNALSVPVADTVPAIFTLDASGRGQGAILNQDGTINSVSNPA